jgi:hypothetical protein
VRESRFAHAAEGLHASGDTNGHVRLQLFGGFRAVVAQDFGNGVSEIEALSVCGKSQRFDLRDAFVALLEKIVFQ